MGSRGGGRAADRSSPVSAGGEGTEPATIAESLVLRAQQYGMRTGLTDWAKVAEVAQRSQKATAALARTVDDEPLRPLRPVRR